MRKALVIMATVAFLFLAFNVAIVAPAAPAAQKSVTVTAGTGNMTGKLGIGTGGRGVGLRYWLSDTAAIDGNFGFSLGEDKQSIGDGAFDRVQVKGHCAAGKMICNATAFIGIVISNNHTVAERAPVN